LLPTVTGIPTLMIKGLIRGAMAGAAGTTALNAAGYADMAWRGRPSSSTPQQAVEELARRAGVEIPGSGGERDNRLEGVGALAGIATGIAGELRAVVLRLGPVLGPVLLGAAAMAATDVSLTRLGLTDPREWDAASWLSDTGPHLAYGVVSYAALRAMSRR
jgi:hypothetical protein